MVKFICVGFALDVCLSGCSRESDIGAVKGETDWRLV